MRVMLSALIVLACLWPTSAKAQEQKSQEELKKLYDEAVVQLKAAQDRKNELAAENEKLQARVADLEGRLNQRDIEASEYAERTWSLRARCAAWDRFISRHPDWKARWEAFLAADVLDPFSSTALDTALERPRAG